MPQLEGACQMGAEARRRIVVNEYNADYRFIINGPDADPDMRDFLSNLLLPGFHTVYATGEAVRRHEEWQAKHGAVCVSCGGPAFNPDGSLPPADWFYLPQHLGKRPSCAECRASRQGWAPPMPPI